MSRHVYEQVSSRGFKSGRCAVCGKPAERSQTFTNTINPFNRNEDGTVRTFHEVWQCVNSLRLDWEALPVAHARCES